ncbi:MAG: hypothetical protein HDR47_00680 [Bacteroides sp.]|nr:hypothetical protein [Bacteroides sp.]
MNQTTEHLTVKNFGPILDVDIKFGAKPKPGTQADVKAARERIISFSYRSVE